MENSNFKYQLPISRTSKAPSTFNFSTFFLDNVVNKTRQYHGYSSSPLVEQEYQELPNIKYALNSQTKIFLTSDNLKKEYTKKTNYYNSGLKNIFIFSFFIIFNIFFELKYLGPSESNVAILILTCINASFCFILLVNIRGNVLLDTYQYLAFYLFSVIETIIFLSLFTFKFINFILVFGKLKVKDTCKNKYKCPGYFIYLFILSMNLIIFLIFLIYIKFIIILFLDSFNILILRNKTFFQRQIEINENKHNNNGRKIEFKDGNDERHNNSLSQLNSTNALKTE